MNPLDPDPANPPDPNVGETIATLVQAAVQQMPLTALAVELRQLKQRVAALEGRLDRAEKMLLNVGGLIQRSTPLAESTEGSAYATSYDPGQKQKPRA